MNSQLNCLTIGWAGRKLTQSEITDISRYICHANNISGITLGDIKVVQMSGNEITTTNIADFVGEIKALKNTTINGIPEEILANIVYAADSIRDRLHSCTKKQVVSTTEIFAAMALFCATKPSYSVAEMLNNAKVIVKGCEQYGAHSLSIPQNLIKACKMVIKTIKANE